MTINMCLLVFQRNNLCDEKPEHETAKMNSKQLYYWINWQKCSDLCVLKGEVNLICSYTVAARPLNPPPQDKVPEVETLTVITPPADK